MRPSFGNRQKISQHTRHRPLPFDRANASFYFPTMRLVSWVSRVLDMKEGDLFHVGSSRSWTLASGAGLEREGSLPEGFFVTATQEGQLGAADGKNVVTGLVNLSKSSSKRISDQCKRYCLSMQTIRSREHEIVGVSVDTKILHLYKKWQISKVRYSNFKLERFNVKKIVPFQEYRHNSQHIFLRLLSDMKNNNFLIVYTHDYQYETFHTHTLKILYKKSTAKQLQWSAEK